MQTGKPAPNENPDLLSLAFYIALDDACMDRLAGSANPDARALADLLGSLLRLAMFRADLVEVSVALSIVDADGKEVGRKVSEPAPEPRPPMPNTAREWAAIPEVEDDPAVQTLAAQCVHLAKRLASPDGSGTLLRWARKRWEAERPCRAEVNRPDPLLPAFKPKVSGGNLSPERERGRRLFGPGGLVPGTPANLPDLFHPRGRVSMIQRVPILALSDAAGRPVSQRGRGAPLALRLPVESMLAVNYDNRRDREIVRIVWTVGELRSALFARRGQLTRKGRPGDWELVQKALKDARDRWIPLPPGFGLDTWYPFALRSMPQRPDPDDNDEVVVDVAIPPGAGEGPPIDRNTLRELGRKSVAPYRAYIAVQSANWMRGITRRLARKRWWWASDRSQYPVFTFADLRELAFGTADRKNRTRKEIAAPFETLPGTTIIGRREVDRRTGARGWRIVPDAAAEAILRREGNPSGESD